MERRNFAKNLGLGLIASTATFAKPKTISEVDDNINHLGPKKGYTPQIGALVSMLDWVSDTVIKYNKNISIEELDYIHDADSNSIGSLIMHVAATKVIYQDITFHNLDDFSPENKKKWNLGMDLGEDARKNLIGNPLSYYKDAIAEARAETKIQMKKKDDEWLLGGQTEKWDWNNYCKWFHVVEHYANHRGQMTWYKKRIKK